MKKARLIVGMTAAIPAAAAWGFTAPPAAHAAQATTAPAQQVPLNGVNGKTVRLHGIQTATTGPQWTHLSEGETLFKRGGGTSWLADSTNVFVTCYYYGAPNSQDHWWDHITSWIPPGGHHINKVTGHLEDRYVDFGGTHHYWPWSVGIKSC